MRPFKGGVIFIPSYSAFMTARGKPNEALFAISDGLHLDGAGIDVLESIFQQALSTKYMLTRIRSQRTRKLVRIYQ